MAAEQEECEECVAGAPMWIVTFSDLMSLLLTFFVLLLSFADMEVKRFRQVAASLKEALGVQRDYVAEQLPMGTSIIKKEFKPGKQDQIDFDNIDQRFTVTPADTREMQLIAEQQKKKDEVEQAKEDEKKAAQLLEEEVDAGQVEISREGVNLILRIRENATFASGSDKLQKKFLPILFKISKIIKETQGMVDVVGHTDNVPIKTVRFRSNWELSSGRAVSVGHALLRASKINPKRMTIVAKGETQPIADNRKAQNRARNRRVEVILRRPSSIK